jgi:hypothetical protein
VATIRHFRRHEGGGPHDLLRAGDFGNAVTRFGDTEVEQLDVKLVVVIVAQKDVRRLEIAMQYALIVSGLYGRRASKPAKRSRRRARTVACANAEQI